LPIFQCPSRTALDTHESDQELLSPKLQAVQVGFYHKKTAFIGLTDKEILGRSDGVFLSLLHLLHV